MSDYEQWQRDLGAGPAQYQAGRLAGLREGHQICRAIAGDIAAGGTVDYGATRCMRAIERAMTEHAGAGDAVETAQVGAQARRENAAEVAPLAQPAPAVCPRCGWDLKGEIVAHDKYWQARVEAARREGYLEGRQHETPRYVMGVDWSTDAIAARVEAAIWGGQPLTRVGWHL